MIKINQEEVRVEALNYLAQYDSLAASGDDMWHERTASALAEHLLESKFSERDEGGIPSELLDEYFEEAKRALLAAGLPA